MSTTTACRTCGAPILWVRNIATGRLSPVNAATTVIYRIHAAEAADGTPLAETETGHISHFATCPDAEQHRHKAPR